MYRAVLYFASVICSALILGCGPVTDADLKCGSEKNWHGIPHVVSSSSSGGTRRMVFQATDEPTDICSEEHAKPSYTALANTSSTKFADDIKITAIAGLPFVTPTSTAMVHDGKGKYSANLDVGLRQAYEGFPAHVSMQIVFEFPTRGGYELDSAYLYNQLLITDIYITYREHVASAQ